MDSQIKRNYRKKLCSRGFIHFNGIKTPIILRNISLTGVLVDINTYDGAHSEMLLKNLTEHCEVDIKLPEMNMSAEAELMRVENHNSHLLLGLKFINAVQNPNKPDYERKAFRKKLTVPGELVVNDQSVAFETVNISTGGMMLFIKDDISIEANSVVAFNVDALNLSGELKIVWLKPKPPLGIAIGVEFLDLESKRIKHYPTSTLQ
jgi:c-di-GMP-binding flagellar brake protein YcgR